MSSKRRTPLKTSRSTTKVHRSPRTSMARPTVQLSVDHASAAGGRGGDGHRTSLGLVDRLRQGCHAGSMTQTQARPFVRHREPHLHLGHPGPGRPVPAARARRAGAAPGDGDGELPHPPIMDTLGMTDLRRRAAAASSSRCRPRSSTTTRSAACTAESSRRCSTRPPACAVHTTLAVGETYTSLDLTVKFLRAGHRRLRACSPARARSSSAAVVRRSRRRSSPTRPAGWSPTPPRAA